MLLMVYTYLGTDWWDLLQYLITILNETKNNTKHTLQFQYFLSTTIHLQIVFQNSIFPFTLTSLMFPEVNTSLKVRQYNREIYCMELIAQSQWNKGLEA